MGLLLDDGASMINVHTICSTHQTTQRHGPAKLAQ